MTGVLSVVLIYLFGITPVSSFSHYRTALTSIHHTVIVCFWSIVRMCCNFQKYFFFISITGTMNVYYDLFAHWCCFYLVPVVAQNDLVCHLACPSFCPRIGGPLDTTQLWWLFSSQIYCPWLSVIQSSLFILYMITQYNCDNICLWWFHGPQFPTSCWTTIVDPTGINISESIKVLSSFCCLSLMLIVVIIIFCINWYLLISCMMTLIGWLSNNNVAGLGKPGLIGVELSCNRARYVSVLVLKHCLSIHFMNLMHASTCPLLWWWYEDDTACSMFRLLQNSFNFSETKLPTASDITFLVIHTLKKWSYTLILFYLLICFLSLWLLGTCCDDLQCKDNDLV